MFSLGTGPNRRDDAIVWRLDPSSSIWKLRFTMIHNASQLCTRRSEIFNIIELNISTHILLTSSDSTAAGSLQHPLALSQQGFGTVSAQSRTEQIVGHPGGGSGSIFARFELYNLLQKSWAKNWLTTRATSQYKPHLSTSASFCFIKCCVTTFFLSSSPLYNMI